MHWLNTTYTMYFNRRHRRSGHLFQGRYKSAVVEKGGHLAELTRYIHLNPARAGLVEWPEAYAWSSYEEYVTGPARWEWLEMAWTLEQFGGAGRRGRARYRKFVEEGLEGEVPDPLKNAGPNGILGGESFVVWVLNRFLDGREDSAAAAARREFERVPIGDVIRAVSEVTGEEEAAIRARGRHGNSARELAMYLARRHSVLTNVAIGAEFGGIAGTNVSHVSRKVRERLRGDRKFGKLCMECEENLFSER